MITSAGFFRIITFLLYVCNTLAFKFRNVDKRTFLKSILAVSAGVLSLGFVSAAKVARSRKKWNGIYKLPELRYGYADLEPFIDAETMKIHHSEHHQEYTNNLNASISKAGLTGITTFQLFKKSRQYDKIMVNNAAGYSNHRLYWSILAPAKGSTPSPLLKSAIVDDFGSYEQFKDNFEMAAKSVFGSGWAWLIMDSEGHLKVTATQNHNNPLMESAEVRGMPLLCIDVWEHAYYNKNQNRREDYLASYWSVVDWDVVSKRFERFKDKPNLLHI